MIHILRIYSTRSLLSFLTLLLMAASATAQIIVVGDGVSMGKVVWNEHRTARVVVENAGRMAQSITAVQTDCDCLTTNFRGQVLNPGERANIDVTFTAPLMGTYRRNVLIYTSGSEEPLIAMVQASVVREVEDDTQEYPIKVGDIELSADNVEFSDVNRGEMPQQTIYIRNNGMGTYEPTLMHLPKYITATYEPTRIFRGRTGKITLTLNSSELPRLGLTQASIYLSRYSGDKVSRDNEITIAAIVHPALQSYTQTQMTYAPVLQMDTAAIVFDATRGKRKMKTEVLMTNIGRTALRITSAQVFHPAINISINNSTIEPGKSAKLEVAVDTQYLNKSKQPLRILLTTNDPKMPQVFVNVKMKK